jgi:tetratricopeptide (TPR) repeat protein
MAEGGEQSVPDDDGSYSSEGSRGRGDEGSVDSRSYDSREGDGGSVDSRSYDSREDGEGDQRPSAKSFGEESYHSEEDRSYKSGEDDRSFRSGEEGSHRDDDRSYRSGEDSRREGDSYVSGDSRSRSDSYRSGDSRKGDSRGSFREGGSRGESYRSGDSKGGSYQEGDSRGDSYASGDSRGDSFMVDDSRREDDSRGGSPREGKGPLQDSFASFADESARRDGGSSQASQSQEDDRNGSKAQSRPVVTSRQQSFADDDEGSRKTNNSRLTGQDSTYDSEAPSFAEDVDFSPTRPASRRANGFGSFEQPAVVFENGGFADEGFGNFPISEGPADAATFIDAFADTAGDAFGDAAVNGFADKQEDAFGDAGGFAAFETNDKKPSGGFADGGLDVFGSNDTDINTDFAAGFGAFGEPSLDKGEGVGKEADGPKVEASARSFEDSDGSGSRSHQSSAHIASASVSAKSLDDSRRSGSQSDRSSAHEASAKSFDDSQRSGSQSHRSSAHDVSARTFDDSLVHDASAKSFADSRQSGSQSNHSSAHGASAKSFGDSQRSGSQSRHSLDQEASAKSFADSKRSGSQAGHSSAHDTSGKSFDDSYRSGSQSPHSSAHDGSGQSFADSDRSGSRSRHSALHSNSEPASNLQESGHSRSQSSHSKDRSRSPSPHSRSISGHSSAHSYSRSEHSQSRSHNSSDRSRSRYSGDSRSRSSRSGSQSLHSSTKSRSQSRHSSPRSYPKSPGSQASQSLQSFKDVKNVSSTPPATGDLEFSMMLGDVFGQPQELFSDYKAKQQNDAISEHSRSEDEDSERSSFQSSLRSESAPLTPATKTPTGHSKAFSMDTDIVSRPEMIHEDEGSMVDQGDEDRRPELERASQTSQYSKSNIRDSEGHGDSYNDDQSLSGSERDTGEYDEEQDGSRESIPKDLQSRDGTDITGLFGDHITLDSKGAMSKMSDSRPRNGVKDKPEPSPSKLVNVPGNRDDENSLELTVSTIAESLIAAKRPSSPTKEENESKDTAGADSGEKRKTKTKRKRRKKKSSRSEALLEFVANVNDAMLELEGGEQRSGWVESKENNLDSSAHRLLHGYEALLGILLQLSDELELISTFAKAKKKKDVNLTVHVQALKAVLSFAQTLDQLFTQLKPILQDCFEEEPDEEMDDMLYRLNSLVDLLSETTHRVGEKQEWNERAETIYVTLLELMERETLELTCYFDDVDTPEYELSANIHEAWSATGHIEELRALQYASDPWLFRQLCYEVMVSIDYPWCPDTSMLMEICGIDASMLEEEPDPEYLEDDELAPIPQAAEHVLDKVNGDPLPRPATLASILRRILPPRAMTDPTLLDNFTSIRNTIRNPLGLSATNIVSISSIPEVLNDPDALGVGGVGKTTLAAMVASHPDVRKYFIDGVAWVYIGDKELNYSRYTQCLRELVAQLDFYQGVPLFAELLHTPGETLSKRRRREEGFMIYAHDTITELLLDRSVLIILDDVCFEPDLDWFDFAPMPGETTDDVDSTCALVVTTRCRTLLPAADTVEIDMLDEADAISLLIQESGQLSHSLMAESREARSVVRECANHPLAVKSVGRWLNLKHATAGVVSSVEEIHADVIKSMDKILKGGDHNGTDMMYEILSMSLSPAINGEPTSIIKFCLAAFVVTFCDREYISDFALTEPTPIIPMDMAELLFETLLEMNESSLLKEGSLFHSQKKEAAVLIPEALSALGVLKVITYSDSEEAENPDDEQKFLQIMHFIHQEYGEFLCKEDEALQDLTKEAERLWNRALVEAYLAQVGEWDIDLEDARHSYALEMIISHMIRGGMFGAAAELLADRGFVRGRLLSLGRENATRRHVKDCEALFKKLRERRSKGNAKLEPRTVMKQAYQALGGQLAMEDDEQSMEDVRIRDVEVARAHYEIGFSLADKRCWDASIAHWEISQELLVSALGTVEVVAGILYNIGVVYAEMNEYEQALDSLKQCLRIRGTIHGEEHILYAQTIQKIGDVFLGMSDYHEAMESYNWALDVMYIEPSHHRVDIGEILDNKGSIHYSKGEIELALQCHQDSLKSKQVDLGEDHPELAITYQHIGNCLSDQANIEDAIVHFEEAIRLKELDPEGGPERDADVLTIEGVLHNLEGSQEQGLECYEKSLQILVTKVPHRKEKVASLLHLIGCVYLMSGEHKKAMKLFEESLQARRKVLGFVHLDVASTLFNMAFLHQTRNRLDKALKCLEEALKIRQLRLPDSEKVAVTHEKIGTLARAIGKTKKAEIAFIEALRIRKLIHGEQHEALATVLQELGDLNDDLGEYDYAMNFYIDALDIRRNRLGPDDVAVAETLYSMGFTLHNNDASDRALVCFEESLSIRRFQLGEDSKEVGDTLNMMGFLKAKRGELDDALTLLWDALRIRKLQEDHVKVSETLKNIGNVHREKQEQDLAIECYEECLRIRRTELGTDHEKVADALIAMGNVQSDMDRTEEAMRSYQEAFKIRTMVYGEHDESVAAVLQYMGTMEFRTGDHEKARDLLTEFIRIRRDNNTKNDGDYVNVLFMIGNIHKMQGNEEEAQVCWAEAYEVFQELGLAETNPQIAKVMNHLLKVEASLEEQKEQKKKARGAGVFGRVTGKVKDTLREEKLHTGGGKKRRKGKGIQL